MSLKLTFLALKKVVQVVQNGGLEGGGVEVIWTISKKTSTFFVKPSLTPKSINWNTKKINLGVNHQNIITIKA